MAKAMNNPAITVVMPVYNSERYLVDAIESMLNQTFTDFEFLIFDDGSTDNSPDIIAAYAKKDPRIIATFSPTNRGYVVYLNEGIQLARAPLIARMDSDDIALPRRLEAQKCFFDINPQIGVLGTAAIEIDEQGSDLGIDRRPTGTSATEWRVFFSNPFAHPSVMYRRDIFDTIQIQGYDPCKMPSEDYDLWCRIMGKWRFANIDEPLIKRRTHRGSTTSLRRKQQWENSSKSQVALWKEHLDLDVTNDEVIFLRTFHKGNDQLSPDFAFTAFQKLVMLKEWISRRHKHLDPMVHEDFFRRSLYLGLKARSHRLLSCGYILAYLVVHFPALAMRFLVHRKI